MTKVSIIVPVYNVEKYLRKCLESLVNQTLSDIEIIVVNDESPDNSQSIIDEYKLKYGEKIKSIIKKNGGQGSARNEGLKVATGEYITYVDSDDYVALDMCEKMYNRAIQDESDIVTAGICIIDENYKVLKEEIFKLDTDIAFVSSNKQILFDRTAVCNKLYKSSILKNSGFVFRENKWYEDFDFSVKVSLLSEKISIIQEPLYYYLLRQGSTMNNSNIRRNLEILEAMDNIVEFCRAKSIYKEYYDEIEFLAVQHIYIPTICRIIRASKSNWKEKKNIINKILEYLNNSFPNYRKNKYITKYLTKNKIAIFKLLNLKLYKIIWLLFKLKKK